MLAESVAAANGIAAVSTTPTGAIAFRRGGARDRRQLIWFDRNGAQIEALGDPDIDSMMSGVEISADDRRVITSRVVSGNRGVWAFELPRSGWTKLSRSIIGTQPQWSPDGQRFAMVSSAAGQADIYVRALTPEAREELLVSSSVSKGLTDWSRDGRFLLYNEVTSPGNSDLMAYSFADRKELPVASTAAVEYDAKLSPDGRWVAYQSNESGPFEVYVQPFLRPGQRLQVSRNGGVQARWRADGHELYFVNLDEQLMAVKVVPATDGERLEFGDPLMLFRLRIPNGVSQPGGSHQQYTPSSSGDRFLVNTLLPDPDQPPITLMLNWQLKVGQ